MIILQILLGIIFLFFFIVGAFQNLAIGVGILISLGIILSALICLVFLQFLNSQIKMTKAAEYYIARIEKEFMIK